MMIMIRVVWLLAFFILVVSSQSFAAKLVLPVLADQNIKLGEITLQSTPNGVHGKFSSQVGSPRPSLKFAASLLNASFINWYQLTVHDNQPPVKMNGAQLHAPYVDPPCGGYGPSSPSKHDVQWADQYPWYWDMVLPPPPFNNRGFTLSDNSSTSVLLFIDQPAGHPNQFLVFKTWLAAVDANHTLNTWLGGWLWLSLSDNKGNVTIVGPIAIKNSPTKPEYQALIQQDASCWFDKFSVDAY